MPFFPKAQRNCVTSLRRDLQGSVPPYVVGISNLETFWEILILLFLGDSSWLYKIQQHNTSHKETQEFLTSTLFVDFVE